MWSWFCSGETLFLVCTHVLAKNYLKSVWDKKETALKPTPLDLHLLLYPSHQVSIYTIFKRFRDNYLNRLWDQFCCVETNPLRFAPIYHTTGYHTLVCITFSGVNYLKLVWDQSIMQWWNNEKPLGTAPMLEPHPCFNDKLLDISGGSFVRYFCTYHLPVQQYHVWGIICFNRFRTAVSFWVQITWN